MVENIDQGGLVRRDGKLVPVPAAHKSRAVDFGNGPVPTVSIPWGDVSTAWRSTKIPNIEVFIALPRSTQLGMKLARVFAPLLATAPAQAWLKRRIRAGQAGPNAEQRARGRSILWGEAQDEHGQRDQDQGHFHHGGGPAPRAPRLAEYHRVLPPKEVTVPAGTA